MNNISIKEQCGRDWSDELLSFPVVWKPGAQRAEQGNLGEQPVLTFTGPGGTTPTQFTGVARHPDGSLKSADAWCRVDLQADETLEMRLVRGQSPPHPDTPYWESGSEGEVEVGNDLVGALIPADGVYEAGEAPGPIVAVRLPTGEWIGDGSLDSECAVTFRSELISLGPLFVKWQTTIASELRTLARIEGTIYAGEDFIRIRENSSRDSDLTFELDVFPGLSPDRLLTKGGGEHLAQAVRVLDHGRSEDVATVDFNSGHHQMSLSWAGLYQEGGEGFVGIVELEGCHWTNLSTNRLVIGVDPPGSVIIESPLQGGIKEWALVCSTTDRNLKAPDARECNHLSVIHQRYTEVPLQKIKDWVLDWEPDTLDRPFLQADPGSIELARAKVQSAPDLLQTYQRWAEVTDSGKGTTGSLASAKATLWIALGEERYAREAVADLEREIRTSIDRFWAEGALMRLIIFDGRSMKMWMQAYDVLAAGGFIEPDVDRRLRRDMAFISYAIGDPEFFPKDYTVADHNDPDSFYYGLGHRINDAMCPPNFHTEYYTTYGMMGCLFRTHPMAAAWREEAAQRLERQLEVHYYDSGAYVESPNYQSHSFVMISQLANCLRRCGNGDFFEHPRLKAQHEFFIQMQTPPILLGETARKLIRPWAFMDWESERLAMLPGNGNSGYNCSDMPLPTELAVAAATYKDRDPELSQRLMTTWRRAGRPIANSYNDLTFLLLSDPDLPGMDTVDLKSSLLTGSYATFRGNPETIDEVFVLTKNGTATHHNDFDEGGFTIWAYGSPIASDFGYHVDWEGKHYGVGDTWKHNCVEFDGKSSGYLGIEKTSPPERWLTDDLADLLVSYIPIKNFRDLENLTYEDVIRAVPIEYRRYTLFVKPHYLIVLDSILESQYAHKWWLHAQADEVKVDGPRVRFKGTFGVDLIAHFITPEQPKIQAGEWTWMKHISATQGLAKDWRVFVAPALPDQEFKVTSELSGRVIHVATPEYTDTICLSHYPFEYNGADFSFYGRAGVLRRYKDGLRSESAWLDGSATTEVGDDDAGDGPGIVLE